MPRFSPASLNELVTISPELQALFSTVVRGFDCKILEGHRTLGRQRYLYEQGRIRPGPIVTHCDGVTKVSNHQRVDENGLCLAVDVVPYPVDRDDVHRFYRFAGYVQRVAEELGIKVQWGGDWEMKDYPHWELVGHQPVPIMAVV